MGVKKSVKRKQKTRKFLKQKAEQFEDFLEKANSKVEEQVTKSKKFLNKHREPLFLTSFIAAVILNLLLVPEPYSAYVAGLILHLAVDYVLFDFEVTKLLIKTVTEIIRRTRRFFVYQFRKHPFLFFGVWIGLETGYYMGTGQFLGVKIVELYLSFILTGYVTYSLLY